MTLDEMHMNRRTIERDTATAEIGLVLNRLMDERRNPDHWERVCLARALAAVFSGCHEGSSVCPYATRPAELGGPSDFDRCDLPFFRRVWDQAMVEPVRQFPHLGPVVFTGGTA